MENKEITVIDLLRVAVKWIYLLVAGMLIFGVAFFIYSKNCVEPKYQASTKYCIQTRGQSIESDVLDSQRTVAYAQLVLGTYIDILNTRDFAQEVTFYMNGNVREGDSENKKQNIREILFYVPEGKEYTTQGIKNMITYKSQEEKVSFDVSVESDSYTEAYAIACCIETIASDYIEEKYPGVGIVTVIDKAILSDRVVNDRVLVMTLVGIILGAFLMFLIAYLLECADTRIKDEKSLSEKTGVAVIGIIPDMNVESSAKK